MKTKNKTHEELSGGAYEAGCAASRARGGCATDEAIRREGFAVERRPKDGPVLWRLGSRIYTQDEVLVMIAN